MNLKDFIIGNPLFYYEQNLQGDSQCYQNPFGQTIQKPTSNDAFELNLGIQIDQLNGIRNNIIESINDNIIKPKLAINKKNQYFDESNDSNEQPNQMNIHSIEIHDFNSKEEIEKIFEFMNKRQKFEIIKNDELNIGANIDIIKIKNKNEKIERCLKYPKIICEILINSMKENQQEIINIINEMKDILYKYPYKIFGRIGIYVSEELTNLNKNANAKNVNDDFYDELEMIYDIIYFSKNPQVEYFFYHRNLIYLNYFFLKLLICWVRKILLSLINYFFFLFLFFFFQQIKNND